MADARDFSTFYALKSAMLERQKEILRDNEQELKQLDTRGVLDGMMASLEDQTQLVHQVSVGSRFKTSNGKPDLDQGFKGLSPKLVSWSSPSRDIAISGAGKDRESRLGMDF